eukprot:9481520-Pyramimonas_sp.AAC.1
MWCVVYGLGKLGIFQLASLRTGAERLMHLFSGGTGENNGASCRYSSAVACKKFNKVLAEVLTENDTALQVNIT